MRRAFWLLLISAAAQAQPALNGLGASSYFCVDRDGDGYGTGPVKLGPFADLVIDGTDNTKVTSASHSFVTADIGRVVTVTAGSGFNLNWYIIQSVSSGAAILLKPDGFAPAVGTVSSTGGSWVIYGCSGPDADDLDATVHTYAQASAKYGTMQKFLAHLGYTPTRIWLLDSTGSPTAGSCTPATFESGCDAAPRSVAPPDGSLAPGDMIMLRANFAGVVNAISGNSSAPFIVMGYPGETPYLGAYVSVVPGLPTCGVSTCLDLRGKSWTIVDGIQENGSVGIGDNSYTDNPHTYHDNILRHIYGGAAGYQGLGPHAGGDNVTVEDSVFAHNNYGGSQAGLYLGCTSVNSSGTVVPACANFTVRRNIAYNNAYDGIHWNGVGSGHVWTQNISHSNAIAGFSFQSGLMNSTISANISFNNISAPILIYNYKDDNTCGVAPCNGTGPQTGNLIENNTLVSFGELFYPTDRSMGAWTSNSCFSVSNGSPTPTFDMGHNTFRNNLCVNWGDLGGTYRWAPFYFQEPANLATSTFDHNLTYEFSGVNSGNAVIGSGKAAFGVYNPSADVTQNGEITYSCTSAPFTTGSATNCLSGDPKLVAAQQPYFYDPSLYDLRIFDTSPAFHAGTSTGRPDYDLKGRSYIGSPGPSIGAVERQLHNGTGWHDLGSATSLAANVATVCPANGASSSVDTGGGPYQYQSRCHSVYGAWSGAAAFDVPGHEMLVVPAQGGHTDYGGNEVYHISINTTSPAIARVTNPSTLTTTPAGASPDGGVSPMSRHGYGAVVFLPDQKRIQIFAGSLYVSGPGCSDTWWWDPIGLAWAWKDPLNNQVLYNSDCNNTLGAIGLLGGNSFASAYDRNSHAVYSVGLSGAVTAHVPATNSGYAKYWGGGAGGIYPSATMDTNRRQWVQVGYFGAGTGASVNTLDISGGPSSITSVAPVFNSMDASCAGIADTYGPGLAFHSVLDTIVAWPEDSGGKIWYVNPGTRTCTSQTFSGGPPTSGVTGFGIYGKFSYFGGLDEYVLVPGYADAGGNPLHVYALNLNPPDPVDGAPSVAPTNLGPYTVSQSVSATLTAVNFSGTVTWSKLSGTQPTGISGTCITGTTGTTCTITGTPSTASGSPFSFTIRATDGMSTVDTAFTVTVNAAPSVTSNSLTAGTQGVPYDQTIATTGGTGTVTCAGSGAPTGLSIGSNCHVTGTPSAAGSFTMSITPTDSNSISGSAHSVSLTIGGASGSPSAGTLTGSFTGTAR